MNEMNELLRKRIGAGLSQSDLARAVGVSQITVSRIERGLRRPSVKTAKKIAAVLGFDWTEFYEEQE